MEVVYIDHMGSDLRVVNSARVSFAKESNWDYYDDDGKITLIPHPSDKENWDNYELNDKDKKLINYLANHNHWTPFSHVQITLREKVPIFVARQRYS